MKFKPHNFSCLLSLVAMSLLLTSCSNPESDFKKAEQTNTEQAFGEFITKHPDSPLVAQAKDRIEKNAYEQAKRIGTSAVYDGFVKLFPTSTLIKQAHSDLQLAAYEEARKPATVAALEGFLQRFQSGELVQQAKRELEALEFKQAVKAAAIPSWEAFLHKYSQSTNGPQGKQELAHLVLQLVSTTNTMSAYEDFTKRFAGTEAAKEALRRIEVLDYQSATNANDVTAYEGFLAKHADSKMAIYVSYLRNIQLEERDWNKALLDNSAEAYSAFSSAHPNSARIRVLRGRLEAYFSYTLNFAGEGGSEQVLLKMGGASLSELISKVDAVKFKVLDRTPLYDKAGTLAGYQVATKGAMINSTVILMRQKQSGENSNTGYKVVAILPGPESKETITKQP